MKTLIVFYTRGGTTRTVAEALQARLGKTAQLLEITDLTKRSGILGWILAGRDAIRRKPTIIEAADMDVKKYDLVVVGTPNWGSNLTPAVRTWLSLHAKECKRLAFYAVSGGNHPGKTLVQLAEASGAQPVATAAFQQNVVKKGDISTAIDVFAKQLK